MSAFTSRISAACLVLGGITATAFALLAILVFPFAFLQFARTKDANLAAENANATPQNSNVRWVRLSGRSTSSASMPIGAITN